MDREIEMQMKIVDKDVNYSDVYKLQKKKKERKPKCFNLGEWLLYGKVWSH